jgi:hypothetical protein
MDVKRPHDQTQLVVDQPREVEFASVDETLHGLWQGSKPWFVIFVTLRYLDVGDDSILKCESASTSVL